MGSSEQLLKKNVNTVRLQWCKSQRAKFGKDLHPEYLKRYQKLCEIMDNSFWAPYSGTRSLEEQTKIYSAGRTAPGDIVTNARPGDSAHNWGCATDWAEFRPEFKAHDPWDKADWHVYATAVIDCGLDWGGDWDRDGTTEKGENDFPHCQLPLKKPWRYIGDTYRLHGAEDAAREIARFTLPWKTEQ